MGGGDEGGRAWQSKKKNHASMTETVMAPTGPDPQTGC